MRYIRATRPVSLPRPAVTALGFTGGCFLTALFVFLASQHAAALGGADTIVLAGVVCGLVLLAAVACTVRLAEACGSRILAELDHRVPHAAIALDVVGQRLHLLLYEVQPSRPNSTEVV